MNKKIVIFDLDGTLLNTLGDLADSTNYALNKFGYENKSLADVQSFVGNGVSKLIERAIPNGLNNKNFDNCLKIFKEHYIKNMFNKTTPYPEIIAMLQKLKQENIKIAVLSNKYDLAVKKICDKYFPNLIDIALGENEALGIKKKPDPHLVIKIIKDFNIKKSEAIYVGDSQVDILTAKNSGIDFISVTWGFKSKDFLIKNGAVNIIDNPLEIFQYL